MGSVGFGEFELSLDCGLVLEVDALDVFLDGDLGNLAGQLGVQVGDLGPLGCDLLVGKLVAERRRVKLADQVAPLDSGSLGNDGDDGCRPLDQTLDVLTPGCLQCARLDHDDPQHAAFDVVDGRVVEQAGLGTRPRLWRDGRSFFLSEQHDAPHCHPGGEEGRCGFPPSSHGESPVPEGSHAAKLRMTAT